MRTNMDPAVKVVVEMNRWVWSRFKDALLDTTAEEAEWRPAREGNNISAILRHLRIEAAWHVASMERGEAMPADPSEEQRREIESTPRDFASNFEKLEGLYARFIDVLSGMDAAALEQRTASAYQNFAAGVARPMHLLGYHQATHLAAHLGQIRAIRNQYQKAHGESARFFPSNPSFPG